MSLSRLAGQIGGPGGADDSGTAARFNHPTGVAADAAGNLYVVDVSNNNIRKITPAGVVTTLAGKADIPTLEPGSTDGIGGAARFRDPQGIAVDAAGTVYVVDTSNHTIRKITSSGLVSTFAGMAGFFGFDDGSGSAARFRDPRCIAVDAIGNLYVADTGNHTIRKITPAGVVTTLAGKAGSWGSADGSCSAARFYDPQGIAVDATGNLYVADTNNSTIRKITPAGVVTTLAGSSGSSGSADGSGSAARFDTPCGLAADAAGNLYVADTYNHTIRKITPTGVVSTLAGTVGSWGSNDGTGAAARFSVPCGLAVDAAGNLYVADTLNNTIRKITPAGVVTTLAGSASSQGSADGGGSAARFDTPYGIAADAAGNLYVADTYNHTIRKITPTGVVSTLAGLAPYPGSADGTGSAARFFFPGGIAVDATGTVYVTDNNNHTIRKITPAGVVTTLAGQAHAWGSADGTGSVARFKGPAGIAVDAAGTVYVADTLNNTIRKITPAGVVTTLAGMACFPGCLGDDDGVGSAARFRNPTGIAVDAAGNLYVADTSNNTIRKITPAGVVSTFAGTARSPGSADGSGATARFNFPDYIAIDAAGTLYLADTWNHTIRKITPARVVSTALGVVGQGGCAWVPIHA